MGRTQFAMAENVPGTSLSGYLFGTRLARELWTKNDSYLKANEWWEAMQGTLTPLAKAGGQEQLDEAKTAGLAAIELKTLLARLELLPRR